MPAPYYMAFGLGEYQGSLYVGSSCYTGYGNAAHGVFRFDLATRQFDPNQITGHRSDVDGYGSNILAITDIVFDAKGNMTLATRTILRVALGIMWIRGKMLDTGSSTGLFAGRRHPYLGAGKQWFVWGSPRQVPMMAWVSKGAQGATSIRNLPLTAIQSEPVLAARRRCRAFWMRHTVSDPFHVYEYGVAWLDVGLGASTATAGQRSRAYGLYGGRGG
ncbi:MAG: hypothetical protein HZT40_20910 [Candidatus Thiothrix singaporensis]|uniref:Uncharacterized protein n=1 Tax=Candidatus Thiothrix singaporensis TaxID=2799669 RepID=A0A7L6AX52_9GAMM|nr:MAG: hypothetical protein HZT40_20910 [Candidatus Thiothrix singaporensis]